VHSRIYLGVAAWLVGVSAATGGSLLAVSMLGQGMMPGGEEQQSVTTVNRALAKEAAERAAALPQGAISPRRAASPRTSRVAPPSRVARHTPPPRSPTARPSASPLSPGAAGGTLLTSQGGTLVASCAGARAYLVSWSPQQGFGSSDVVRGPATNAQVAFIGGQLTVTMVVSCDAGVPTATVTAVGTGGSATGTFGSDGD
jgi:hypothetical protein